jgi:hypothetical protein
MMQERTSQGRSQRQGKRSPVVLGIGAAVVASAVTLVIMMGNPSKVTTPEQVASSTKQCQMIPRKLLVSTTQGSGTVRFRASGWLSQPFTLTSQPQAVVFPLPRPDTVPAEEEITIEGNASDLVLTSEVSEYRRVFDSVSGTSVFSVQWKPMKGC